MCHLLEIAVDTDKYPVVLSGLCGNHLVCRVSFECLSQELNVVTRILQLPPDAIGDTLIQKESKPILQARPL